MQNYKYDKIFKVSFIIGAIILLIMGWSNLVWIGSTKITDLFHRGEYFSYFISVFNNQEKFSYLTIHGALDYIPAWLAFNIFGQTNYFFWTILLYEIANILSALFFYIIVAIFCREIVIYYKIPILIIAAIIAPNFVNYRDLFLLISLFLYFFCQQEMRLLIKRFIEVALGLTVALNIFWSFDRGIAGTFSIGIAYSVMAYRKQISLNPLIYFVLAIFLLHFYTDIFDLRAYTENINFLIDTSSQWSYGLGLRPVIYSSMLFFLCLSSLTLLFKSISNEDIFSGRLLVNANAKNAIVLGLLTIFFLKIGTNRADIIHIHWGMWPAVLAFLYAHGQHNKNFIPVQQESYIFGERLFSFVGISRYANLCFLIIFTTLITPASLGDSFSFIKLLISPPANEEIVGDGINWIASELNKVKADCVFDLANHGIIIGLTAKPACTRFTYIVYANKSYEDEIIESLQNKKPPLIVYSSTNWSFNIDQKNMYDRFPVLKNYLDQTYPYEICKYGYCLRYLSNDR